MNISTCQIKLIQETGFARNHKHSLALSFSHFAIAMEKSPRQISMNQEAQNHQLHILSPSLVSTGHQFNQFDEERICQRSALFEGPFGDISALAREKETEVLYHLRRRRVAGIPKPERAAPPPWHPGGASKPAERGPNRARQRRSSGRRGGEGERQRMKRMGEFGRAS